MEIPVGVFVDVRVVQPDFIVFHARKSIGDLALPGAQSLDLGPVQDDARLESFQDMKIVARFEVGHNVGHKQNQPEGRPPGWKDRWLMFSAFPAALGLLLHQHIFDGHVPAHFIFDDFAQSDVGNAQVGRVHDQGTAAGAAAGVELPDATRNEVNQNVGVANFCRGLFAEFRIQEFLFVNYYRAAYGNELPA